MKQALIKFGSRWLVSLLVLFATMGCLPKFEFWIANESNAEYKIQILFKNKKGKMNEKGNTGTIRKGIRR